MIDSPNANIQFTAEQSLQILEWQRRLTVIQDELKLAENNLAGLKQNTEEAIKHNDYLEEEGKNLEAKVKELAASKEELEEAVTKSTAMLAEHLNTTTERNIHITKREEIVRNSEEAAHKRHAELDAREEAHSKKETKFAEDALEVEQARKILVSALGSITWK